MKATIKNALSRLRKAQNRIYNGKLNEIRPVLNVSVQYGSAWHGLPYVSVDALKGSYEDNTMQCRVISFYDDDTPAYINEQLAIISQFFNIEI